MITKCRSKRIQIEAASKANRYILVITISLNCDFKLLVNNIKF